MIPKESQQKHKDDIEKDRSPRSEEPEAAKNKEKDTAAEGVSPGADKVPENEAEAAAAAKMPDELQARLDKFMNRMAQKESKGEPAAPRPPTRIEELERQLDEKDSLLREYIAEHKKAVSQFEVARERIHRNISDEIERGKRNILQPLLDLLDDFDRAVNFENGESENNKQILEGIALIRNRFLKILGDFGVARFESQGKVFDPNLHEAVGTVPVEEKDQDGIVKHVINHGYKINEELLRPARVIVGKFE